MTEQEWLTSTDPQVMIEWLLNGRGNLYQTTEDGIPVGVGLQKLWCWVDAVAKAANCQIAKHGVWDDMTVLQKVEHLKDCCHEPRRQEMQAGKANALRDIVGNPFRPIPFHVHNGSLYPLQEVKNGPSWEQFEKTLRPVPWLTPTVLNLARAPYEELDSDGTLASDRLAVLADCLEESGCENEDILNHLRGLEPVPGDWHKCKGCGTIYRRIHKYSDCGNARCEGEEYEEVKQWQKMRGNHYRGCWVLDLLLGKE